VPGVDENSIRERLKHIVAVNGLYTFYPENRLNALAKDVAQSDLAGLADRWHLEPQVGIQIKQIV
jgi:hypothetical protein